MSGPLRVLSLGAGVQSSTLLLMAARGEFEHMPDVAIFADTQCEPEHVYTWLDYLDEQVRGVIPIERVTAGNLLEAVLDKSRRNAQPPFYVLSSRADRETMIRRQCTKGYKIEPIQRRVRELIGLKPRQRAPREPVVEQWMGISLDEVQRMKDSPLPYITHRYPLIERRMTRHDCLAWMKRNGFPEPPKSACIVCPYTDNVRWRQMRDTDPASWKGAVGFDRALRTVGVRGIEGEAYLHRSLKPLDEVDLSTAEERGQLNWLDECEGMCGV